MRKRIDEEDEGCQDKARQVKDEVRRGGGVQSGGWVRWEKFAA